MRFLALFAFVAAAAAPAGAQTPGGMAAMQYYVGGMHGRWPRRAAVECDRDLRDRERHYA
jgi:hypothetical protein